MPQVMKQQQQQDIETAGYPYIRSIFLSLSRTAYLTCHEVKKQELDTQEGLN